MSDFQRYTAHGMGVSVRTVCRWCESNKIPGAYRTKGGHWRVRKPSEQSTRKHWRLLVSTDYCKSREGRIRSLLFFHFLPPPSPETKRQLEVFRENPRILEGMTNGKRLRDALVFSMLAHGIFDEDLHDENLRDRDPTKYRLLRRTPIQKFIHPQAYGALAQPHSRLMMAAHKLRLNDCEVTPKTLARALGISVATLYRRYKKKNVREAWHVSAAELPSPQTTAPTIQTDKEIKRDRAAHSRADRFEVLTRRRCH